MVKVEIGDHTYMGDPDELNITLEELFEDFLFVIDQDKEKICDVGNVIDPFS